MIKYFVDGNRIIYRVVLEDQVTHYKFLMERFLGADTTRIVPKNQCYDSKFGAQVAKKLGII